MANKRAFIMHGWSGYPEEGWFPWLKAALEKQGMTVAVPNMPHPDEPTIKDWVDHVAQVVGEPDEQTYLIGHSIGCQTILRYLATLEGKKVGGIVLVAGFFELTNLESEEEKAIAKPWLETPIDFAKVKQATDNIIVILSDNDEWVPVGRNKELFEQHLQPKIVIEHNQGHLNEESGTKELPTALEAIVKDERQSSV